MHRRWLTCTIVLLVVTGVVTSLSPRTAVAGRAHAALDKKTCTTKKVHGKKKRVCTTVRPKPTSTPAPTPAPTPVTQLTSGDQVDAYLTQAGFQGYILLERHGQVILSKGYGMADVANKVPNTAQTQIPMLGVDAFMEAIAVFKLQEEGKLSIQNKICSYVPDCPSAWQPITLQEVLTDTSGISRGDFGGYEPLQSSGLTIPGLIGVCKSTPLASTPGTPPPDIAYDCDRALLSMVVAQRSGESLGTFMQQTIFGPAGMASTSVVTSIPSPSVHGYRRGTTAGALNAGGYPLIYSTVQDVERMDQALLADQLISQQSVTTLFTPVFRFDPVLPIFAAYGTVMVKANAFPSSFSPPLPQVSPLQTNSVFWESIALDWSGLILDSWISPDDGTIAIWYTNDSGWFSVDDDNTFVNHTMQLLWGK